MWGFWQLFWGNRVNHLKSSQLMSCRCMIWEIKGGQLHLRPKITGGSSSMLLIILWPCLVLSTHTSEGTLLMNLASQCLRKVGRCLTPSNRWGRQSLTTWLFPKMLSTAIAVEISECFIGQLPVDTEVYCNPGTCSLVELGYGLQFSESQSCAQPQTSSSSPPSFWRWKKGPNLLGSLLLISGMQNSLQI